VGHYEILGVDPEASVDEIKRSYLRLASREHPDLHNETPESRLHAESRMREINVAWSILSDPDERAFYDRKRLGVDKGKPGATGERARGTTLRVGVESTVAGLGAVRRIIGRGV